MRELRKFDVPTRATAFKARVETLFLKQVDVFQTPRRWAPFPLAVMTCVGIEMIGSYKYGDAFGDSNDHFKNLIEDMHNRFTRTELLPEGTKREKKKLSYFVYKGFRNSLAHGFYGRWVFITHDPKKAKTFRYSTQKQVVVLNVYWFYKRFKDVCNEYLRDLVAATDPASDPLKTFNNTFEKNFALWV